MKQNSLKLSTINDLRRLISATINDLRNDQVDVKVAAAIGNLTRTQLKIIELADIEERLNKLEQGDSPESIQSPISSDVKARIAELGRPN